MEIYIIGFFLSLVFLYVAERRDFKGKSAKILVLLGLVIPCLIAGLRSYKVGTDVETYVRPLFLAAGARETFAEYIKLEYSRFGWDFNFVADFEIGFTVLVFIVQRMFNDLQVLLFVVQALIIIPIYKGLRAFGKSQPVWLGMAVFYLMFYNQSLNLIRQWIAMSLLFYAFHFLRDRKYRKYFAVWLVAVTFHTTALVGLIVFGIYHVVATENSYGKVVKMLLIALVGAIAIFGVEIMTKVLELFGLNYGGYIKGTLTLLPNQILYRVPILVLFLLQWNRIKKTDRHAHFYLLMVIFDLLTSQLTSIYVHSGRVGVYFSEYYMLAYPALYASSAKKDNRKVIKWAILAFLCVYWWYVYVLGGTSETVPYKFFFDM